MAGAEVRAKQRRWVERRLGKEGLCLSFQVRSQGTGKFFFFNPKLSHIYLLFLKLNIYFKKFFVGVQLIFDVVLVSAVQQSESVIHTYISTLFQILFPYRPLQSIEQSSLCYTVGPYQLSILYLVVCICQSQSPNLSLPPLPPSNHKCVFYICDSTSVSEQSRDTLWHKL